METPVGIVWHIKWCFHVEVLQFFPFLKAYHKKRISLVIYRCGVTQKNISHEKIHATRFLRKSPTSDCLGSILVYT